jgi:hypothetical protein
MTYWSADGSIVCGGRRFRVSTTHDDTMGPPWRESDGHGKVRELRTRDDKRAGERLMDDGRGNLWAYDVAGAMAMAKRDGWGVGDRQRAEMARRLGREPTAGENRAEAVELDYRYCAGWLLNDWCFLAVRVEMLGAHGEVIDDETLWGVESLGNYWQEVAKDMAEQIISRRRVQWRAALREARERAYWLARGVVTVRGAA